MKIFKQNTTTTTTTAKTIDKYVYIQVYVHITEVYH